MHGSVELSLVVVEPEGGSVNSDHISDFLDDGEIFEPLGVEDHGGEVASVSGSFLVLDMETAVHNFEGANVLVCVCLVGEAGINDGSIEMMANLGSQGSFVQFNVVVLEGNLNI